MIKKKCQITGMKYNSDKEGVKNGDKKSFDCPISRRRYDMLCSPNCKCLLF